GFSEEEIASLSILDFIHPDDRAMVEEKHRRRLQGEDIQSVYSFRGVTRAGDIRRVEIKSSFILWKGKPATVNFLTDITEKKQAQEQQNRLTAILENTSDVVATATPEGKVTYLNLAGRQMAGWEKNELLEARSISDFHPPESSQIILTEGLPTAAASGIWTGETFVLRRDGRTIPVSQVIIAHRTPDGRIRYYSTIMRDISERKLHEKNLQDSLMKLGAAQEAAKIGFWDLDLINTYLEWSEGVKSIFDLEPEDPTPSFDDFWSYVLSEDREFVQQQVKIQLAPMEKPSIHYEYRILTGKGRIKCIDHIGRQEFDQNGKLIRIYGSVQDITERKQVEEALRISEARYKAQYHGSPIPTFTWQKYGADFVLVSFNNAAREITSGRVSEFVGSAASQMYHDYPSIVNNISRCYNRRIVLRDEVTSQHFLPGRQIQTTYAFVPPDFVLVHIEDLTEQRLAEAEKEKLQKQLAQAQKLESIGRLAGGVAHDFNNILAVIIGHTELALDHIEPATPPYADLQAIRKATEHSAGLVRQLLAFARKQTIAPKVIHLNETVQNMFNILKRLIGEDIDLTLKPQADLWPVRIDPGQVDQILINLCINARDAIAQAGKVIIETRNLPLDEMNPACRKEMPPGEYVLLLISDNGCGMDAATLEKIFDPFFTTKEIGKGSGLGLSTVYGIVSQNYGCIHVESAPGRGTAFYIYLPRHPGEQEKIQAVVSITEPQTGRETILLVEDEPSLLKMTVVMLRRLGYFVLPALTPEEAVGLATGYRGHIQLLITDVIMPHMNGRELADQLQSIRPDLRCLFMSGYTADVIAKKGILEKGVHFIQKPFQKKDLAARV
ncbi:MAG TPA: PAS domain S-box protein, partial [Smithellaceae bacterium]|nr:PAS domain S-box protein [Smithellaceae bacterium]